MLAYQIYVDFTKIKVCNANVNYKLTIWEFTQSQLRIIIYNVDNLIPLLILQNLLCCLNPNYLQILLKIILLYPIEVDWLYIKSNTFYSFILFWTKYIVNSFSITTIFCQKNSVCQIKFFCKFTSQMLHPVVLLS